MSASSGANLESEKAGRETDEKTSNEGKQLLVLRGPIDEADSTDVTWSSNFKELETVLASGSEHEVNATMQEKMATSTANHTVFVSGFLYGCLTDSTRAPALWRQFALITKDGYQECCHLLTKLVHDKFHKLHDSCRSQTLWIFRELIGLEITILEPLCTALLRHVAGGDISPRNRWLAEALLKIFMESKKWLYAQSSIVPLVWYTYVRIVGDHTSSQLSALRKSEAAFVCQVWREKYVECRVIGRDAVRLLHDLIRMPEFKQLWDDMLTNPSNISESFTGIDTLLKTRTPSKFLMSRLTPEMEAHLMYMLTHVKMGNQRRYQQWFVQRHLTGTEAESVIPDLVRFICCVYHPPNHVIASDVVPRWAALGWLVKSAKSQIAVTAIKQAVLFDWLSYDSSKDRIMNLEPGVLLMTQSVPKYTDITESLLHCLFNLSDNYLPSLKEFCRKGVFNAGADVLKRGVIASWAVLSNSSHLNPQLRTTLRTRFKGLCRGDPQDVANDSETSGPNLSPVAPHSPTLTSSNPQSPTLSPLPMPSLADFQPMDIDSDSGDKSRGKDEEDDDPLSIGLGGKLPAALGHVADQLRLLLKAASSPDANNEIYKTVESVVRETAKSPTNSDEAATQLAHLLHEWFGSLVRKTIDHSLIHTTVPPTQGDTVLNCLFNLTVDSSQNVMNVATDTLKGYTALDDSVSLRFLIKTAASISDDLGVILGNLHSHLLSGYRIFLKKCSVGGTLSLEEILLRDLRDCATHDSAMFIKLVPLICRLFPEEAVGQPEVVRLVTTLAIPASIVQWSSQLSLNSWQLMGQATEGGRGLLPVLVDSLQWTTVEQNSFWVLVAAEVSCHHTVLEGLLPRLLSIIDTSTNFEALCGLQMVLRNVVPSNPILTATLNLDTTFHEWLFAVWLYWASFHLEAFQQAIAESWNSVLAQQQQQNPTKSPRSSAIWVQSSLELLKRWIGHGSCHGVGMKVLQSNSIRESLVAIQKNFPQLDSLAASLIVSPPKVEVPPPAPAPAPAPPPAQTGPVTRESKRQRN